MAGGEGGSDDEHWEPSHDPSHGGPEGVDQIGFNLFPQLIAARGYLVLQPNYRGSAGRGVAFSKGDHNDLGGTEYTDIINGVDALIERADGSWWSRDWPWALRGLTTAALGLAGYVLGAGESRAFIYFQF